MEYAKSEATRIFQLMEDAGYKVLEVRDEGYTGQQVLAKNGTDTEYANFQTLQIRVAVIPQ